MPPQVPTLRWNIASAMKNADNGHFAIACGKEDHVIAVGTGADIATQFGAPAIAIWIPRDSLALPTQFLDERQRTRQTIRGDVIGNAPPGPARPAA